MHHTEFQEQTGSAATLDTQTHAKLFEAAYSPATSVKPSGLETGIKESLLVVDGAIVGAARQAIKDPAGTVQKVVEGVIGGAIVGAAAAAESPVIAGAAVAAGAVMTGEWIFSLVNPYDKKNQVRNATVVRAMTEAATSSDPATFARSKENMRDALGPTALDIGIGLGAGGTADFAGLHGAKVGELFNGEMFRSPCTLQQPHAASPSGQWMPTTKMESRMDGDVLFRSPHGTGVLQP